MDKKGLVEQIESVDTDIMNSKSLIESLKARLCHWENHLEALYCERQRLLNTETFESSIQKSGTS